MEEIERYRLRGVMISWLKLTIRSGVLDRNSRRHDVDDLNKRARDLLVRLRASDGGLPPSDPLVLEFDAFRRSVERLRRDERRTIAADRGRRAARIAEAPRDPVATERANGPKDEVNSTPVPSLRFVGPILALFRSLARPRPTPTNLDDPLWDRWLD